MTDSTLSLVARLAANLFVDAVKLAKPGARLAAKVGDRVLRGSPFNEREAQQFLTMGGADRLAEAEAERDVYEPDPLWSAARVRELDDPLVSVARLASIATAAGAGIAGEWQLTADEQDLLDVKPGDPFCGGIVGQPIDVVATHEFNTVPNWSQSSAPVDRKPADVAGSPESTPAPPLPGVDSGHQQPVHAGVTGPGMNVVTAIAAVLAEHLPEGDADGAWHSVRCYNPDAIETLHKVCKDWREWQEHLAPLIAGALKRSDRGTGAIDDGKLQVVVLSGREYERYLDGALNDPYPQ